MVNAVDADTKAASAFFHLVSLPVCPGAKSPTQLAEEAFSVLLGPNQFNFFIQILNKNR